MGRPPLEGIYIYILCFLIGYSIADLSILKYRPEMLPRKAPPTKTENQMARNNVTAIEYRSVLQRNIFSDDGKIPPPLSAGEKGQEEQIDAPAVLSKLPLKLMGTIVHLNPKKSIATINNSGRNETNSFRVGERIDSLAEITKIERRKVTFRNLSSRRLEYIEIPEEDTIRFGLTSPKKETTTAGTDVKKDGEFRFRISRDDLNKYTNDLPTIITQARMVPNIIPGSGGKIDGFRFVSIQPDSIFTQLGFKPGDIIKGVNDEPVTSPTQAMEMYQALKSTDSLSLNVNRNGRDETFDYTIE